MRPWFTFESQVSSKLSQLDGNFVKSFLTDKRKTKNKPNFLYSIDQLHIYLEFRSKILQTPMRMSFSENIRWLIYLWNRSWLNNAIINVLMHKSQSLLMCFMNSWNTSLCSCCKIWSPTNFRGYDVNRSKLHVIGFL